MRPISARSLSAGVLTVSDDYAQKLTRQLYRNTTSTLTVIKRLMDAGRFADAKAELRDLKYGAVLKKSQKQTRTAMRSLAILGSAAIDGAKNSIWAKGAAFPFEVDTGATRQLLAIIENRLEGSLIPALEDRIDRASRFQKGVRLQKAKDPIDPDVLARDLNRYLRGEIYRVVQASSNLVGTRVAAYGVLHEARVRGLATYRIDAVLDARTTDICRAMDGRIMKTQTAFKKVQDTLLIQDPTNLAKVVPWPENGAAVEGKASDELQAMGFDVPPFHYLCRSVLTLVDSSTEVQEVSAEDEKNLTDLGKGIVAAATFFGVDAAIQAAKSKASAELYEMAVNEMKERGLQGSIKLIEDKSKVLDSLAALPQLLGDRASLLRLPRPKPNSNVLELPEPVETEFPPALLPATYSDDMMLLADNSRQLRRQTSLGALEMLDDAALLPAVYKPPVTALVTAGLKVKDLNPVEKAQVTKFALLSGPEPKLKTAKLNTVEPGPGLTVAEKQMLMDRVIQEQGFDKTKLLVQDWDGLGQYANGLAPKPILKGQPIPKLTPAQILDKWDELFDGQPAFMSFHMDDIPGKDKKAIEAWFNGDGPFPTENKVNLVVPAGFKVPPSKKPPQPPQSPSNLKPKGPPEKDLPPTAPAHGMSSDELLDLQDELLYDAGIEWESLSPDAQELLADYVEGKVGKPAFLGGEIRYKPYPADKHSLMENELMEQYNTHPMAVSQAGYDAMQDWLDGKTRAPNLSLYIDKDMEQELMDDFFDEMEPFDDFTSVVESTTKTVLKAEARDRQLLRDEYPTINFALLEDKPLTDDQAMSIFEANFRQMMTAVGVTPKDRTYILEAEGIRAKRNRFRSVILEERYDAKPAYAVYEYTGSGYRSMNQSLRDHTPLSSKQIDHVKRLEAAIDKSQKLKKDTVVWRGTRSTELRNKMSEVGIIFQDDAISSLSLSRSVAEGFAGPDGALTQIIIPKGTPALHVELMTQNTIEFEVLLKRGMQFRVINVDERGGGQSRTLIQAVFQGYGKVLDPEHVGIIDDPYVYDSIVKDERSTKFLWELNDLVEVPLG